jgi:hypothetical protein
MAAESDGEIPMSEELSPVDALKAFRDILVDERRRIIREALVIQKENGSGGASFAPNLSTIQEHIEAVDRAITDEESHPKYADGGAEFIR